MTDSSALATSPEAGGGVRAAQARGPGEPAETGSEAEDFGGRDSEIRDEVLVLDFGGQYSQLIARRIRECGVFAELLPHDTSLEAIRERGPRGLVLSGGPASV